MSEDSGSDSDSYNPKKYGNDPAYDPATNPDIDPAIFPKGDPA